MFAAIKETDAVGGIQSAKEPGHDYPTRRTTTVRAFTDIQRIHRRVYRSQVNCPPVEGHWVQIEAARTV